MCEYFGTEDILRDQAGYSLNLKHENVSKLRFDPLSLCNEPVQSSPVQPFPCSLSQAYPEPTASNKQQLPVLLPGLHAKPLPPGPKRRGSRKLTALYSSNEKNARGVRFGNADKRHFPHRPRGLCRTEHGRRRYRGAGDGQQPPADRSAARIPTPLRIRISLHPHPPARREPPPPHVQIRCPETGQSVTATSSLAGRRGVVFD
jgi:hypothetical protein